MVDTTLSRKRGAAGATYVVRRLTDPDEIRELLAPEGAYAAYALAQLEPDHFALSDWYTAIGPQGQALVVHSRSGLGRALFSMGDPQSVEVALSLHPGPRFTFGSLRPEHRQAVQRHFVLTREQLMLRMSVTAETFRESGIAATVGTATRLRRRHVSRVNSLYSVEGGPTAYSARHIEEGVYYGVSVDDELISIAGTHVVSRAEGVAVVGNVFTHPLYRNRGLATVATEAVTRALLEDCRLVALTVEEKNVPGVAVYRRLGYQTECTLHETPLIRKEPTGLLSLARRLLAGSRGRGEGVEVVLR